MCRVIHVLVCGKLDSNTYTMCTSARSTGPYVEKDDFLPRLPDESAETHMEDGQSRNSHMVTKRISPALSRGVDTLHGSRREIRRGKQTSYFCTQNAMWLQSLKKELGSQCHGRRFRVWRWEQAVVQCLGYEWVKVAQNSTVWRSKLEEVVNWKKTKKDRSHVC